MIPWPRDSLDVASQRVPVLFVRNRRARNYILSLSADATARVTIPPFGSKREAWRFVRKQRNWLAEQLRERGRHPALYGPWTAGTKVMYRGESVAIRVEPFLGGCLVRLGDHLVTTPRPCPDFKPAIQRSLRTRSAKELVERTRALAARHGWPSPPVKVRGQRTLWGSCSANGTISLNWKLIFAPDWVLDYVILHELVHLFEMSHSKKFWRRLASVCPAYERAERWLKEHSRWLHCD